MRLIDADFLKKRIEYGQGLVEFTANQIEEILEVIDDAPTVERPHGKWVQVMDKDGEYLYHKCSNCGQKVESGLDNPPFFNFCMDCGADMRKRR